MTIDIILIVLGALLMIVGIAGSVLPVLPGPPLSYVGIILLHLTSKVQFSTTFLVVWAVVIVIVEILNYYIPIWGTKKLGGGAKGVWGCTIGLIVGIFILPPWGIIIFPFVGAVVGELIDEKEFSVALKAGLGSFIGFLAGTVMQIAVAVILAFYFFKDVIDIIVEKIA